MSVPVCGERDAIGIDARETGAALERLGHEIHWFEGPQHTRARRSAITEALLADRESVLICHVALDRPADTDILRRASCRRVLRCHARAMSGAVTGTGHECAGEFGIEPDLDLYLADSTATIEQLAARGVPRESMALLPRVYDAHRLLSLPANSDLLGHWQSPSSNWLTVGDPASEAASWLLDAFALYLDRCDARARLIVIRQRGRNESLEDSVIRDVAHSVQLDGHLDVVEAIDDAALKAAYLSVDALVSVEPHIDGCYAAIEAFALGVPVVTNATPTMAATVGDSALVWVRQDPALFAASIERLRQDPALRCELRRRGFARFDRIFSPVALDARVAALMERFT